mgnify:CR=1 FL=1|tara:strand:- start:4868 stop:5308 length:441 start_codon:yes stop_codon:yes gene_type:complete
MQPFQKAWTFLKENYLVNEQFRHANSLLSPELMEEYYRNLVGREYEADNLNEASAAEQANHLREFVNLEEHGEAINQFEDAMRVHDDMEDQEHEVLYGDKYAPPKSPLDHSKLTRLQEENKKDFDMQPGIPIEQRLGVNSRGYPLD